METAQNVQWSNIWQKLGERLKQNPDTIELAKLQSQRENPWFTSEHIETAIQAINNKFLQKNYVDKWLSPYLIHELTIKDKRIGIVCAGNIPMVAFHDIMCTITSGHRALIKLSHKDKFLIPAVLKELTALFPELSDRFSFVDKLEGYDAVIATGSNNSHRYFKAYFGHVPHIFRKNRMSIGILHEEDDEQVLSDMAKEIFMHFGLGCRNISKLFVPKEFDLNRLFKATIDYSQYALHTKYRNNFIYHSALFQMNKVNYFTNDLMILLETEEWHSPLSVVYFERYNNLQDIVSKLKEKSDDIQAVYSSVQMDLEARRQPGQGQQPELWDYADQVDTLSFLMSLE